MKTVASTSLFGGDLSCLVLSHLIIIDVNSDNG